MSSYDDEDTTESEMEQLYRFYHTSKPQANPTKSSSSSTSPSPPASRSSSTSSSCDHGDRWKLRCKPPQLNLLKQLPSDKNSGRVCQNEQSTSQPKQLENNYLSHKVLSDMYSRGFSQNIRLDTEHKQPELRYPSHPLLPDKNSGRAFQNNQNTTQPKQLENNYASHPLLSQMYSHGLPQNMSLDAEPDKPELRFPSHQLLSHKDSPCLYRDTRLEAEPKHCELNYPSHQLLSSTDSRGVHQNIRVATESEHTQPKLRHPSLQLLSDKDFLGRCQNIRLDTEPDQPELSYSSHQLLFDKDSSGSYQNVYNATGQYTKDHTSSVQVQNDHCRSDQNQDYYSVVQRKGRTCEAQLQVDATSSQRHKFPCDQCQKKKHIRVKQHHSNHVSGDQCQKYTTGEKENMPNNTYDLNDPQKSSTNIRWMEGPQQVEATLRQKSDSTPLVKAKQAISPPSPELIHAVNDMAALFTPRNNLRRTAGDGGSEPAIPNNPEIVTNAIQKPRRRRSSPVRFELPPNRRSLSPPLIWQTTEKAVQESQARAKMKALGLLPDELHTEEANLEMSEPEVVSSIPKLPPLQPGRSKVQVEQKGSNSSQGQRQQLTRLEKSELNKQHSHLRLPMIDDPLDTWQPHIPFEESAQQQHGRHNARVYPRRIVPPTDLPPCLLTEPMRFRPVFMKPSKPGIVPARPPLAAQTNPPPARKLARKDLPRHLLLGNFKPNRGAPAPMRPSARALHCLKREKMWR